MSDFVSELNEEAVKTIDTMSAQIMNSIPAEKRHQYAPIICYGPPTKQMWPYRIGVRPSLESEYGEYLFVAAIRKPFWERTWANVRHFLFGVIVFVLLMACTPVVSTPTPEATGIPSPPLVATVESLTAIPTTLTAVPTLALTPIPPGHTPPLFQTATAVHLTQTAQVAPTPTQEVWDVFCVAVELGLNVRSDHRLSAGVVQVLGYPQCTRVIDMPVVQDNYRWYELFYHRGQWIAVQNVVSGFELATRL